MGNQHYVSIELLGLSSHQVLHSGELFFGVLNSLVSSCNSLEILTIALPENQECLELNIRLEKILSSDKLLKKTLSSKHLGVSVVTH